MRISFRKFLSVRKYFGRKFLIFAIFLLIYGIIFFSVRIKNTAHRQLARERSRLELKNRISFEKTRLIPHLTNNVLIKQNIEEVRDIAKFRGSFFAATNGGLIQLSTDGKLLKHFTVLDGLSESDLTSLEVFSGRLFIGSRSKGIIAFDGNNFESYRFTETDQQAITSFLIDDGRLLIGTFNGGLIEFDGEHFREIQADDETILTINYLAKSDSKLFVGTFKNGLWIRESGLWKHFTNVDGLPSNRIVGIAERDDNIFIATDFGIVQATDFNSEKPFRLIKTLPTLSSITNFNNQIFLTKANGTVFTLDAKFSPQESAKVEEISNAHLKEVEENLFLLSNHGILQKNGNNFNRFAQTENDGLTDNFVSAIAFDKNENLWIGTFRNGIDVFTKNGKKLKHIESETIREINFLKQQNGKIVAATSAGLLNFSDDFSSELLIKPDQLLSTSITHFSDADFLAISTSKGISLNEKGQTRNLSSFNGLPSNSTYTTLFARKSLFVGTLGGLAEIRNGKIIRIFKDSNSNLKQNWVTALCLADERIFIGTYGGGIFELTASGEIRSFVEETSKFVVNPNAMFSDSERLYIGTLKGVKVLDLRSQKWSVVRDILPSETVMAITGNRENIYFGTTNGIAQVEKNYFVEGEKE
jgi:ligand-binding sensor domain-containing protein